MTLYCSRFLEGSIPWCGHNAKKAKLAQTQLQTSHHVLWEVKIFEKFRDLYFRSSEENHHRGHIFGFSPLFLNQSSLCIKPLKIKGVVVGLSLSNHQHCFKSFLSWNLWYVENFFRDYIFSIKDWFSNIKSIYKKVLYRYDKIQC